MGLILCALALGLVGTSWAQGLAQLPPGLSASDPRVHRRAELIQVGEALRSRIANHNATCSSVSSDNAAQVQSCTQEQAALNAAIAAYQRELAAFNADLASATPPPTQAGVAAAVRGEVYAQAPGGEKHRLTSSSMVNLGDHITTGPDGRIQLLLLDQTTFTIGSNSDMVVDEFVYDPKTSVGKITAEIAKGFFRWVTGKIAQAEPHSVKVMAPVGCLCIRGTDFETFVAPDHSGFVKLYKGEIDLVPKNGGATVTLKAGQELTFDAEGNLGQPGTIR